MNWYLEVLKKYAIFSGRAQRAEYWYFILFNTIISIVLTILDNMFDLYNVELGQGVLSGIYTLAVFIPSLAVGARRLHDIGKSGWWQLIMFIPLIGLIVLIIWFAKDSQEDNEYGKNPKGISSKESTSNDLIE